MANTNREGQVSNMCSHALYSFHKSVLKRTEKPNRISVKYQRWVSFLKITQLFQQNLEFI